MVNSSSAFSSALSNAVASAVSGFPSAAPQPFAYLPDEKLLTFGLTLAVTSRNASAASNVVFGSWTTKAGFKRAVGLEYETIPRFFRIGTVPVTPWAYYKVTVRGFEIVNCFLKPE